MIVTTRSCLVGLLGFRILLAMCMNDVNFTAHMDHRPDPSVLTFVERRRQEKTDTTGLIITTIVIGMLQPSSQPPSYLHCQMSRCRDRLVASHDFNSSPSVPK